MSHNLYVTLLHEKSLTLPNWFCPSFFPPRGPKIHWKIWPPISAYLHFTPVEEKNCVSETREFAGLELLFIGTIRPTSPASWVSLANKHCRQILCPVESPHFQNSKHRLCKQSDGGLNTVLATSCNGYFETNKQTQRAHILIVSIFPGLCCQIQDEVKDVVEGEDVVLECRFSPSLSGTDGTLYWIRSSANQHDNVAIGDTPYSTGYTWVLSLAKSHTRNGVFLLLLRC